MCCDNDNDKNYGQKNYEKWMNMALDEAKLAYEKGEIPIGAVIVKGEELVGRGHNTTETSKDPTNHAEMIAIRQAAKTLGGWRLTGCTMYVTTEPCTMCAGALVLSRLDKVVVGTRNEKAGACLSLRSILQDERLNHEVEIEEGVLKDQCSELMKDFFRNLRKKKA